MSPWLTRLRLPLVVFSVVVLQRTLGSEVVVDGVHPDLLTALFVVLAMGRGPSNGAAAGFGMGLVADLFTDTPFGLWALTDVIVGYLVGMVPGEGLEQSWWRVPVAAGLAGSAAVLLYAVVGALFGQAWMIDERLWKVALVVAVFNAASAPLLWRIASWARASEGDWDLAGSWR